MGELDHAAKLALRVDASSIIRLALPGAREVVPLPHQVVSAERTADAAYLVVLGDEEVVVPIEMEAEPTSDAVERASRAACALYLAHRRPVRPVIYYLHPAKGGRRPKSTHRLPIGSRPAMLRFEVVAWWELSAEQVLAVAGGALPFVVLTRDARLEHVRVAARAIEELALPIERRDELKASLFLLASTIERFPRERIRDIIPKEIYMKSWAYEEAVEDGRAKGRAEGRAEALAVARRAMLMAVKLRLGSVPDDLQGDIERATDLAALETAMAGVEAEGTPQQVADRVRAALG